MSGLRFGYVTNGLTGHRLDDVLDLLAGYGYAGVALTLDHVHFDADAPDLAGRAAALRERLAAHGLSCVVETGGRFVLDPRRKHFPALLDEGRERRVAMLERAIDVAVELESPVVSLWSGAKPEALGAGAAWERLTEALAPVVDHAARAGVTLGFEPEPGMFVERLADYETLAARLGDPPALGLTLDIGHIVCLEDDSIDACVRQGADRLVHVHIEDMRRGVHDHLMFGEGDVDVPEALAALRSVGYGGLVAVELSRHAHAAHETVPRAIEVLRAAEREEAQAR